MRNVEGHYIFEVDLIDENDRIVRDYAESDTAMEAIRMVKKLHGNGWTVKRIEVIFAK